MTTLAKCLNRMMPKELCRQDFYNRKAKTLTALHLIFLFFSIVFIVLSKVIGEPSQVPYLLPLIATIALILIFKIRADLVLSGNLICLVYFTILVVATTSSGGIYSDDIVWAGITPVFAFLFVSKRMGLLWYLAYGACLSCFYYLEINGIISFKEQTNLFSPSYFLISWLFLFGMLISIIFVFSKGESIMIESLLRNKKELIAEREELHIQTQALKIKEQQLLKLNESLEHYAYAISHDLKEPLRTVRSYTQLLNRSLENKLTEKDEIYMNFISSGTERMSHLLEDLLEFSRISEVHHEFVPVNLNDVVLLVVNNLNRTVRESRASIEVEDDLPLIKGTQSLLVVVIQNLVSNAIKFRHIEREPVINIYHKKEDDQIVICVKDNGIGIADDYKEKVFELFNRLHTREQYDGSGIGLTTCGKIIKNLGGKIWLESELGEGTTFMFSIPNKVMEETAEVRKIAVL